MADEQKALIWAQIQKEIQEQAEESGLNIGALPRRQSHVWVAKRTPLEVQMMLELMRSGPEWAKMGPKGQADRLGELLGDMTPMVLHRTKPWPANPAYLIAEIFDDVDELRIYAVAASAVKEPTPVAMRYRIAKACPLPVYTVDALWTEVWIGEIVKEWETADGEVNLEGRAMEAERESVLAYLRTLKEGYRIVDLIADIDDGTHLEIMEDDLEEPDGQGDAGGEADGENGEGASDEADDEGPVLSHAASDPEPSLPENGAPDVAGDATAGA